LIFPPLRPLFEAESGDVGFVVDIMALEQGFLQYFGSSSQSLHRPLQTLQNSSSWAGIIRQIVANEQSGLSHPNPKKKLTTSVFAYSAYSSVLGGSIFLRNIGKVIPGYMAQYLYNHSRKKPISQNLCSWSVGLMF
jgi:hypothetical protein